ncbi:MAG: HNH endonuclease [Actinomycetota bacterium]|nr:HNH endonuclease [Actinomycetota bacterium]
MGELTSALDMLAGDDLFDLSAAGLLERTAELVRVRNRLDAELARTVRRAELAQACEYDGSKSMASWLRGHARLSPSAAAQMVRNGRALESLPAVAAAWAAGAVTAEQVAVIAPVVKPEHVAAAAEQGVDLSEVDVVLADTAATRQHVQLGRVVQHYLSRLDPDGPEPDPTEARSLSICRHTDGSRTFRGELDAVGGEKFEAMLESFVQADRPAGDPRTRAQQLADALVQAADVALTSGRLPVLRTVKPHVLVTIPLADLVDPATGPGAADTGFGATISAGRARWLACDGNVTRIVIGPEGQPLDLGRSKRVVPPHLRRAVELRDRTCVFAGCYAPSYWCDVHHLVHWIDGGDTSLKNSGLLCERHHTKVHHGFRVVRQPDGRWRTYRPDGTEILIAPPL